MYIGFTKRKSLLDTHTTELIHCESNSLDLLNHALPPLGATDAARAEELPKKKLLTNPKDLNA